MLDYDSLSDAAEKAEIERILREIAESEAQRIAENKAFQASLRDALSVPPSSSD